MRRSGFAALAVLAFVIGSLSSASAQAPQPSSPTPVQPSPPAQTAPAQQGPTPRAAASRTGVAPAPAAPGQEVRRPLSYRSCARAAKRRGLRGAQRRSFVTRCRIGRETINR